jgi:hypothetical protein
MKVIAILAVLLNWGCVPGHLSKYTREGAKTKAPVKELGAEGALGKANSVATASPTVPTAATVYPVDAQTYRFMLPREDVWEGILDVLLKNYNLTIVDRESGIITTEWDSYFLNQSVYRNKVSVRLRASGRKGVDLVIHNNVEKLNQQLGTPTNGVWLPSEDVANESTRIAQNIAIALNQPLPQGLPVSNIASPHVDSKEVVR